MCHSQGERQRLSFYTHNMLVICCQHVHLTDRWLVHLTQLALHLLMVPDMKSIYYEIKYTARVGVAHLGWIQMMPYCADVKLLQVCLPETIIVPAILHLLDRMTLHHHHFVKFKHHVHWDHKQTEIGFVSNTQCFDKWLYPVVDLGRDGRQCFHGLGWQYVVENKFSGLAIRTRMIRVSKSDMHSIHSVWLCLYPEVTGINSCNITEMKYQLIIAAPPALWYHSCYSKSRHAHAWLNLLLSWCKIHFANQDVLVQTAEKINYEELLQSVYIQL